MPNPTNNVNGAFIKGTLSPRICSSFVQGGCHVLSEMLKMEGSFLALIFVDNCFLFCKLAEESQAQIRDLL